MLNENFTDELDLQSLTDRTDPGDLQSLNYTGVLGGNLFVEAQYPARNTSIEGAGAKSTDLIDGTLIVDGVSLGAIQLGDVLRRVPARGARQPGVHREGFLLPLDAARAARTRSWPATTGSTTSAPRTTTSRAATTGSIATSSIFRNEQVLPPCSTTWAAAR